MNDLTVTIKRSVFPLTRFYLNIDNENYFINPGEIKKIKLSSDEKVYEVIASSYWINKKVSLFLKNKSILSIKHIIPDFYYLIGTAVVIILSILTFLGMINALLFSGIVLLYFLPVVYFTFIKPTKYFRIEVKKGD